MMYLVSSQNRIKDLVNQVNLPQDTLPEEYQNCVVGINHVLKIYWEIVNKSRNMDNYNGNGQTMTVIDSKTVSQALALINDSVKYKMDLATNDVVITDGIKFIQTNKEKLTSIKKGDKESKEPSYDDDKDQLEKSRKRKLENKKQLIKPMRTDLYSYI